MGGEEYIQKREEGIINSGNAKCKECRLDCFLKDKAIRINPENLCFVPKAREHAEIFNHPVIDRDILLGLASKSLKCAYNRKENLHDNERFLHLVIKFKEAFFPEVQKTANLNINYNAAQEIVDAILKNE